MLTDRKAIFIALRIAIDSEEALIDAYRDNYGKINEEELGVINARKNIKAFKRIIERYYPNMSIKKVPSEKTVSILDLMKGE